MLLRCCPGACEGASAGPGHRFKPATKQRRNDGFRGVINIAIVTGEGCPANRRETATSLRATSCLKVSRRQKKGKNDWSLQTEWPIPFRLRQNHQLGFAATTHTVNSPGVKCSRVILVATRVLCLHGYRLASASDNGIIWSERRIRPE